jgi:hypothetical protein
MDASRLLDWMLGETESAGIRISERSGLGGSEAGAGADTGSRIGLASLRTAPQRGHMRIKGLSVMPHSEQRMLSLTIINLVRKKSRMIFRFASDAFLLRRCGDGARFNDASGAVPNSAGEA